MSFKLLSWQKFLGRVLTRFFKEEGSYQLFGHADATSAAFFVHGLNGDKTENYWSNLGKLLAEDFRSIPIDFFFWGYLSNLKLAPNATALLRRQARLVGPRDVSDQIASFIEGRQKKKRYLNISMFGHSLGGSVSADLVQRHTGPKRIVKISHLCLASTPTGPHGLAKWHSRVGRWSNPQISFLASKSEQDRIFLDAIPGAGRSGTHTSYIRASNDEVVKNPPPSIFCEHHNIVGSHDWPKSLRDRAAAGYDEISGWVQKVVEQR